MENKIKELEERVKELETSQLRNGFASLIKQKMLESELHNEIANRCEDRCNGDKSKITMYMNFIYRLKTLCDDIELFNAYFKAPDIIGTLTDKDTFRMCTDINGLYWWDESPKQIINRLNKYNDYLYFDELTEESFKNGYYVEYQGDYFWENNDIPYQEKYKELIKCILNQLNLIDTDSIKDRFPKLVKLIARNKKVCQDKLNELENKE